MTISSNTRKAGPYDGNGVTTAFPFEFKIFKKQDIAVTLTDINGADSTLTLDSAYSVTLNANQDANPGGTITYPISGSPLATGTKLTISGALEETQGTDITNAGGFFPQVVEDALDRVTILVQQIREFVTRSIKFPVSDDALNTTLPGASQRANKAMVFGPNGEVGVSGDNYTDQLANVTAQAGIATTQAGVATTQAGIAATKAGEAAASAAAALQSFNDLRTRYFGAADADPTADPLGGALTVGDEYFNTTANLLKRYNGATWVASDINTANLAAPSGSSLIGFIDSAVGAVATTVQGILRQILSSAGSSLVGFIQAGTGATARTVQDALREQVSVFGYMSAAQIADVKSGAPVIDVTAAIQAAIDANKGKTIVFPSGSYLAAGVLLSGASYNNTTLRFEGELFLKARPTSATNNFQGAWVGLAIKDCDNVTLHFKGHGNRANQPMEEHVYLVGLAGATNVKVPYFACREIRGDGMYVSQSDWSASSANTDGLTIGFYEAVNTADDGRNGLSIISADNVAIDVFRSNKVGGVVVVRQPGGLDIEPNTAYQSCKNIVIGAVNVVTAGTSGLSIHGNDTDLTVTNNVVIGEAAIVNTSPADLADAAANITQTNNHVLNIRSVTDVTIKNFRGKFTNAYGDAVIVINSDNVNIDASVRHVREGARIGDDAPDATGNGVTNSDIKVIASDISRYGVRTGKITNCKIRGAVSDPKTAYYSASTFGVFARAYTQTDSEYSVSVLSSANWVRSYRNDNTSPATFSNTVVRDCDLSGTTWAAFVNQVGDMQVIRYQVRGVTDRPAVPSVGTNLWLAGQYVRNSASAVGSPKGWYFAGGAWVSEGNL